MNFKKPKKSKFWKNEKIPGYIIILNMCTKNHNHIRYRQFLGYGARQDFFVRKPKFWKNEKNICRCHHSKLVQQKTRSYDICLLRYGAGRHIFCRFRPFFVLLPHYWPRKLKFGKKYKKHLEILFHTCVTQMMIICIVPEILSATEFFVIWG